MEIKNFTHLPKDAADIREAVFMDEQGFKDEFDEFENQSTHFVGYVNDLAVATARVHFAEEYGVYKIGRIAVLKEWRGKHLGELIVSAAEKFLQEKDAKNVVVLAQEQASGFYEKLGYLKTDCYVMEEHCPHVLMTKNF